MNHTNSSYTYKDMWRHYLRFLVLIRPFWKSGIGIAGLMLINIVLQIPSPFLTKALIDEAIPNRSIQQLMLLGGALLVLFFVKSLSNFRERLIFSKYKNDIAVFLRELLFGHVVGIEQRELDRFQAGYLKSRVDDDVDHVDSLFITTVAEVTFKAVTFLIGVTLCLHLHTFLTLFTLALLLPYALLYGRFARKMHALGFENQEKWGLFQGNIIEFLGQLKHLKTLDQSGSSGAVISAKVNAAVDISRAAERCQIRYLFFAGLVSSFAPLIVLCFGALDIIQGNFTLGGLVAFTSCITYIFEPARTIISLNLDVNTALSSAKRIFEVLDLPREEQRFGSKPLAGITSLAFDQVTFHYEAEKDRGLKETSFSAARGDHVCIIGETGSGKSTLANLLLGLYQPCRGRIRLNNELLDAYSLVDIRRQIGYVCQEPRLFSGTIRENLMFGNGETNTQHLETVLDVCELRAWITSLPHGLDTRLQEAGEGVSGGEKQRLAVARILLRQPSMLVLDEISSALDPDTEKRLFDNILTLPWQPIVLNITHRHHLINRFTKVIKMEELLT